MCEKSNQSKNKDQMSVIEMSSAYLEPINGTAIDKRRKFTKSVTESIPNRAHSQYNMQLFSGSLNEHVEQSNWGAISLLGLVSLSANIRNQELENKSTVLVQQI